MPPQSSLPEWLAGALAALQAGDIDRWMAIYAQDAVHEFPFASEDGPRRLEGQDTIRAFLEPLLAGMLYGEFSDIRVHDAGDELIVEATGHHQSASDGAPAPSAMSGSLADWTARSSISAIT